MQFKDVIGQNQLKKQLIKDVQSDRISHAQLFLGSTGFGTLPLAIAFVQYLFCENKQESDSCGECPACKKMQQLQHPDVHFSFPTVQAVSKTSDPLFSTWKEFVNTTPYFNLNQWTLKHDEKGRKPIVSKFQSQEIVKKLSLKSFEGGYKVSIIWMAETMNDACANKLLKIIEEPPQKTVFILLSEQQDGLMPTIISRTQILKVKRVNGEPLADFLKQHHQITDNELLKSLISRADGDVLNAIQLSAEQADNNQNRKDFIQLMRICFKKEVLPMLDWSEKLASYTKENQKNFLLYALYMVRQAMLKNYTDEQLIRASQEELSFLKNFARFITGNNIMDFMKLFDESHYQLERNAHSKLLFTNITFEIMRYIHKA